MPPFQRLLAVHAEACAGDGIVAALFRRRRKVEKGDVAAGRSHPVGIKQVIGGNVVLIDGLLDQPQAENLRVKPHIAGGVGGDGGEVMDAGKLHFRAS
jgi:hypothetical protein